MSQINEPFCMRKLNPTTTAAFDVGCAEKRGWNVEARQNIPTQASIFVVSLRVNLVFLLLGGSKKYATP